MNVMNGLSLVKKYFPKATLHLYAKPEKAEELAQRMHNLGETPIHTLAGLVHQMDYLGLGVDGRTGEIRIW